MDSGQQRAKRGYKDLIVWQKAMNLVGMVYRCSKNFPTEERYGLQSQLRRAVVSIPSNIAEGNGLFHQRQYLRHLSIARGSLFETETQLMLARDFEYISQLELDEIMSITDEIGRMLTKLIQNLSKSEPSQPR